MTANHHPSDSSPVSIRVWSVLAVAVLGVSSAGVIVRAIDGVNPVVIAFWRMAGAALVLSPAFRRVTAPDALRMIAAGVFIAVHFATWFASLSHISVMRSTLLVTLAPVWAGLIERTLLLKPPARRYWWGLGVASPGILMMSHAGLSGGTWEGDALAIIGGITGACYFVIGNTVRQRVGVASYACTVCSVAALVLLPLALTTGEPMWGFSGSVWLLLGALVLIPQMIGHNGLNYVLRFLPASTVTATTLLEPFFAAILAALILNEFPTGWDLAGGVIIVAGVFIGIGASREQVDGG